MALLCNDIQKTLIVKGLTNHALLLKLLCIINYLGRLISTSNVNEEKMFSFFLVGLAIFQLLYKEKSKSCGKRGGGAVEF